MITLRYPSLSDRKAVVHAADQPTDVIGSKTFARSFSFPFKHLKNVVGPEVAACPREDRSATCRVGAHVHPPDGTADHQLRQHAQGQDLQGDVGEGAAMDQLVRRPLWPIHEKGSPPVQQVRGVHGGKSGNVRPSSPSAAVRKRLDPHTGKGYGKKSPTPKALTAKTKGKAQPPIGEIPEEALNDMQQLVNQGLIDPDEALEMESFEMIQEPSPAIGHLESRMLNLENALSRVIQHLEVLSAQPQTPLDQ